MGLHSWGQQDQLCLPISLSLHVGLPEERGWSSSLVLAPFPLSTWHHPSSVPPAAGHPLGPARQGSSQGLARREGTAGTAWGSCCSSWPCSGD